MSAAPISFVIGRRHGQKSSAVASVIFPARFWKRGQVSAWLKRHGFKGGASVETVRGSHRAPQHPSGYFQPGSLRTLHTSGHPQPLANPKHPRTRIRLHYFPANAAWGFVFGSDIATGSHIGLGVDQRKLFKSRGEAVQAAKESGLSVSRSGAVSVVPAPGALGLNPRKPNKRARANPTITAGPRKLVVPERAYAQAITLYRKFREKEPEKITVFKIAMPRMLMQIGAVPFLYYYTTHKGGRQILYRHKFATYARPILASSHDGKALYLIGGDYDFTRDGIVDRERA